ncbi:MAG: heme-binding protein [Myxococcota bacterium]
MSWSRRRWAVTALTTAAAVAIPAGIATAAARKRTEEPKYEVQVKHSGFEVRLYEPRIVAEVEVKGQGREATSAGFRLLADFIFGNNTAKTEVAMTAPVDRTAASEAIDMTAPVDRTAKGEAWIVAFTMPSKYTMESLPKPNDERVHIRQVPPTRYAVMRFSGSPNDKVVGSRMDLLIERVEKEGYTTAGKPPTYARYDPPWTPSFMRRNEIMLELAPVDPEP